MPAITPKRFPTSGSSLGLHLDAGRPGSRRVPGGVPFALLKRFALSSGLDLADIKSVVCIPARKLSHRPYTGTTPPGSKLTSRHATRRKIAAGSDSDAAERLSRLEHLFRLATGLFEGDISRARTWLRTPEKAFAGKTPLALARTEDGGRQVENLIGRLEHGVFT